MNHGLHPQWLKGQVTRQAHANLPDGTVEEEHGLDGFDGPVSHLFRRRPLTQWTEIEGEFRPRLFNLVASDQLSKRLPTVMLTSETADILAWSIDTATDVVDDLEGDDLYFVHLGTGVLATEYGPLPYEPGDYLLVPKGTLHRFEPREDTWMYIIRARKGHYTIPERGLLGQHALFDPAVLEVPEPIDYGKDGEHVVLVCANGHVTEYRYDFDPLNVVGWKGTLSPVRLNLRDIRPAMSERYHLPPPVHTTFVAPGVIVSSWVPRPLENEVGVPRVPFDHRNVDCDELNFVHSGTFFSRDNMGQGVVTFHPAGVFHGPTPGARARTERPDGARTSEWTVGLEVYDRLQVDEAASAVEVDDYLEGWRVPQAVNSEITK